MNEQDQEITLGTGRLLGLFFGLVIICALFFSLGFSLGRRSLPQTVAAAGPAPAVVATSSEAKPSPIKPETTVKLDCSTPGACAPDGAAKSSSSDELTFYKAVEQNEPKAKLEPAAQPAGRAVSAKQIQAPAPEMNKPVPLGTGYMVQVAAVTKQEDADALVNALRRKNYPVITTNGASDKLYHVQVGPFPDLKDAEGTRAKLIGDGYNPILKK